MEVNMLFTKSFFPIILVLTITFLSSCAVKNTALPFPEDENPWKDIRKKRIAKLLPVAMKSAAVDMWIVICRENNNDPLAMHVGGENAGGTAAFIFQNENQNVKSVAISPVGEATALKEIGLHDEVVVVERHGNIWEVIAAQIEKYDPAVIAINSSENTIADGLSYTQRISFEEAIGEKYVSRLISSDNLIQEWLSVKLPAEIEIMKRAAVITAQMQVDAYKMVIPGKTKDSDVAAYLKMRMKELGVTDAWAPAQNPSVNSGVDRGHSHATDKVIQPGDVIQTDFGIKAYDIWCSDIQRFAYVLKEGETEAPAEIQRYFDAAITGHRKVLATMKPGITGWEADKAQRESMAESGSLPVIWGTGHPVGYWAHDAGPALSGAAYSDTPSGKTARVLRPGQTFAFDGFFSWQLDEKNTKTISVEEMAYITEDGAEYMSQPQNEWILIPSR